MYQRVEFWTTTIHGEPLHLVNPADGVHDQPCRANGEDILLIHALPTPGQIAVDCPGRRYVISDLVYDVLCGNRPIAVLHEPIDVTPRVEVPEIQPRRSRGEWLVLGALACGMAVALLIGWYVGASREIWRGVAAALLVLLLTPIVLVLGIVSVWKIQDRRAPRRRCPVCGARDWEFHNETYHRCGSCGTLCNLLNGQFKTKKEQTTIWVALAEALTQANRGYTTIDHDPTPSDSVDHNLLR